MIVLNLYYIVMYAGTANAILTAVDNKPLSVRSFFISPVTLMKLLVLLGLLVITPLTFCWVFFISSVATGGLGFVGLFLILAMIGVFLRVFIKYGFSYWIIVDHNQGMAESFKGSVRITEGVKLKLFYDARVMDNRDDNLITQLTTRVSSSTFSTATTVSVATIVSIITIFNKM